MNNQQRFFYLIIAVLIVETIIELTTASPVRYDQRQAGDLNVQVDIQNVEVVALIDEGFVEDYMDYNYDYEYSDFTVKPIIKPTTSASSVTNAKPLSTWPTKLPTTSSPSSSSDASLEIITSTSDSTSVATASTSSSSPLSSITEAETTSTITINESNVTSTTPMIHTSPMSEDDVDTQSSKDSDAIAKFIQKRCRSGTLPNGDGRCRKINRRRMSILPLKMRLAPKLSKESTNTNGHVISWMSPGF